MYARVYDLKRYRADRAYPAVKRHDHDYKLPISRPVRAVWPVGPADNRPEKRRPPGSRPPLPPAA
jgi:hypothetical protein